MASSGDPEARVCCLPRAGGSARDFDDWSGRLGEGIEVAAVQLPGRLNRFREPALTSLIDVAEAAAAELAAGRDLPLVLFGDCMGALVVFEIARLLRARFAIVPVALVVASYLPPHEVRITRPFHDASPEQLRWRFPATSRGLARLS